MWKREGGLSRSHKMWELLRRVATRGADLAKVTKRDDVWIMSAQSETCWEDSAYKM
jgi:hypothetical protein